MERNNEKSSPKQNERKRKGKASIGIIKSKKPKLETDTECKIDILSEDALVEIIKFLPKTQWPFLERVSRRFRKLVLASWSGLKKIRIGDDFLVDEAKKSKNEVRVLNWILKKLLLRAPTITELSGLSTVATDLHYTTMRSLSQFANLRSVDISECSLRVEALANFLETSSSRGCLKDLKMEGQLFRATEDELPNLNQEECDQLDDETLCSAFGNENSNSPMLKLEKFSVDSHAFDTNKFLEIMDASRLTTFDVGNFYFESDVLISLISRAPNLVDLDFKISNYCETDGQGVDLTRNLQLLRTVAASENLSSLKINNLEMFHNECNDCSQIDAEMEKMIATLGRRRRLVDFSLLDYSRCTKEIVSTIADNMSHLKSLGLCPNFDCADGGPLVKLFSRLKSLNELWLDCTSSAGMNPDVISTMATNLTELNWLNLYEPRVTPETLNVLARLHNLEKLRIERGQFNSSTIKAWSKGIGPKLEFLFLGGSPVTDDGLIALIKRSPRLLFLKLAPGITDRSLRAIAKSCPDLRQLYLSDCATTTTIKGVQAIVDKCSQLKRLRGGAFVKKVKLAKYRKVILDDTIDE